MEQRFQARAPHMANSPRMLFSWAIVKFSGTGGTPVVTVHRDSAPEHDETSAGRPCHRICPTLSSWIRLLFLIIGTIGSSLSSPTQGADRIDFSRDIQPILAD